ncbi:MAG: BON domain-containing protein [Polyangiaceae bacterium]|nr:BON domain-containing protein [Polyangiaceae bacterium]
MRERTSRWYHDDFDRAKYDRDVLSSDEGPRPWTGSRDEEREDMRGGPYAERYERAAPPFEVMRGGRDAGRDGRTFLERYGDVPLDQRAHGDWAPHLRGFSAREHEEGMRRGPRSGGVPPSNDASAGGFRGRGPRAYRRSDERIREEVCDLLTDDDRIDASDIDVTVMDGEVVLSGNVSERPMKHWAEELTSRVRGVADVVNQLRIAHPRPTTHAARAPLPNPSPSWRARGPR